jgi:sugar O-acyltransferase (sialic acid O-acetyltransferase NeuD family)
MRDLVIVGAGGHGRELLDVVQAVNDERPTWRFLGFLDDGPCDAARLARRAASLLGPVSFLTEIDADYVIGVGDSEARRRIATTGDASGRAAAVLVHPAATVGGDVELSPGAVLCAGARVTTNVRLGRHAHLNVNAVVSHDGRVGDFVTLSPGALVNGTVVLEDDVMLGTAAVVTPGRTIGARTWVGAGAVVVDDLPANVVATGVPARVLRTR